MACTSKMRMCLSLKIDSAMKIKQLLYYAGAVLLLAGAAVKMILPVYAPYIYTAGALLFAVMQFVCRERGGGLAVRRLVFQQQIGGVALIAAGILMFTHVRNEWIVAMLIGALFELYTAFRIPQEIARSK